MIFAICSRFQTCDKLEFRKFHVIANMRFLQLVKSMRKLPSLDMMASLCRHYTAGALFSTIVQFNLGLFIDGKFISFCEGWASLSCNSREEESEGILNFCARGCKIKTPWSWVRDDYNQLFGWRELCNGGKLKIGMENSAPERNFQFWKRKIHEFKLISKQRE